MANDGQDPSMRPGGMDFGQYRGEFTTTTVNALADEVAELEGGPVEEYFAVLKGAVSAQGYPDMTAAIDRVSQTSRGTLLRGEYEPVVTGTRNGEPTSTKPAEQWARESVAEGVGHALADLNDLRRGRSREDSTSTIADLRVGGDLDKELFVTYARIFARKPEELDATTPTPDGVTNVNQMGITPEDQAKGVVFLEGNPDEVVRFQKVTVDSNVSGYDLEMRRHNRAGYIRGDGTDYHKLYLVRKAAEPVPDTQAP